MRQNRLDPDPTPAKLGPGMAGNGNTSLARRGAGGAAPASRRSATVLYYPPIVVLTFLSVWWAAGRLVSYGAFGPVVLGLYLVCVVNALINAWPPLLGAVSPRPRWNDASDAALECRTAVIMPVRHEPVELVFGTMREMASDLAAATDRYVEFMILSDSSESSYLEAERLAAEDDKSRAAGIGYRHRADQSGRKAGNIVDFCRSRRDLDYVVVLDADSTVSPSLLLRLIDLIDCAPGVAIVQTTPSLTGGNTALACWQQFTDALYTPEWSQGMSRWQGDFANYWGHNAIIRAKALLEDGGLPPLSGELLSHDMAEAAMLAKAGWGIRLLPNEPGSWEGAPLDLSSSLDRERRWCEGNVQLIKFLLTERLELASAFHITAGALYYVAITASLLLRLSGLVLACLGDITTPLLLIGSVFAIRVGGKAASLFWALCDTKRRRSLGGGAAVIVSFVADVILSWFFSIVFMARSSRALASVLAGRRTEWGRQERFAREGSWTKAWRDFGDLTLVGAGVVGAGFVAGEGAGAIALLLFGGLVIAPLMAMFTNSKAAGAWLRRHAIFAVKR